MILSILRFLRIMLYSEKIDNKLSYDSAYQLSYAFNEAEDEYVGLSFMGMQDSIFYAFDLAEENGHTSDLENDSLKQNVYSECFA